MPQAIMSTASMTDWMQMLDRVQESLTEALQQTEEQERALAEELGPTGGWADAGRRCLEQIDERLRGLEGHLEKADGVAAEVEALLTWDEQEARSWAEQAGAARRRLVGLAGAGI